MTGTVQSYTLPAPHKLVRGEIMPNLTAIIGKPILSVDSSCIIGKVTDVYFDEYCKTAVYICIYPHKFNPIKCGDFMGTPRDVCGDPTIYPTNAEGECRMLLPFGEVQSFSDALVVADGVGLISPLDVDVTALKGNIMTTPVYTLGGLYKGDLSDIHISSTGKVQRLKTAENTFTPSAILKIADVILVKNNSKFNPQITQQAGTKGRTNSKTRNSAPKPRRIP
ncbi:MAG: hypothetical protein K2M36_00335, partial [Clostridia bacterium]|nr:hypothetical protein [Clostridia bacterium]